MQEEDVGFFSFESVGFIFRHPWIIISTIIIMTNMAHAYVSGKPLSYRCYAVLSFELAGDSLVDKKSGVDVKKDLIDARRDLVSKVLLGENIRNIAEEVWPEANEKKDPANYAKRIEMLRDPKSGILIQQDDKANVNMANVSFIGLKPALCYRIVRATVNIIINENRKASEKKIQSGIDFFNKQLEFYKTKIERIDKEANTLRGELVDNFSLLTAQERDVIVGIMGTSEGAKQQRLTTFAKYDETIAQLNLDRLEIQKKRENLQRQLSGEAGSYKHRLDADSKKDIVLAEYSKAIASKELEIASLVSSGYKVAHPQIRKIQNEIERLKELGSQRAAEMSGDTQLFGREMVKEKITAEMEELDFQTEALNSRIAQIKEYRRGTIEQFKSSGVERKDISAKVSRMLELGKEKVINEGYYLDIRKRLEEADLKSRIEKEDIGLRIVVVEDPQLPTNPIPLQRIKALLMGFLLSIVAGAVLSYLVDSIGNSVRSSEDLRKLLAIPVLATIDKITTLEQLAEKRAQRKFIIFGLIGVIVISRVVVFLYLFYRFANRPG